MCDLLVSRFFDPMKTLRSQLKKRIATIVALLETPRRKYSSATIHKLRVEIKKLNASLDLINFCASGFKRKKTFEPFKLIFSQAGKIRELQLEEEILKKYLTSKESLTDYRKSLKAQRLEELDCFFSLVDKKIIARLKRKCYKIIPFLEEVTPKKAQRYLEKKKSKIKKLLASGVLEKQQAHELRKRLKVFNYIAKSLSAGKQKASKKDVLPGLLGKWHDYQVMARHLEKVIGHHGADHEEMERLETIKEEIVSESEILFGRINTAVKESEFYANRKL